MAEADRSAIRYLDARAQAAMSLAQDDEGAETPPDGVSGNDDVSRIIVALSSDYYWESDADHRISRIQFSDDALTRRASDYLLGKKRWEIGVEPVSSTWEEHRAQLEARQPFRDFLIRQRRREGHARYISISGVPRFDSLERFAGYLGVSRDVTGEVLLQVIGDLEVAVMQLLASMAYHDALAASVRLIAKKLGFKWGRYWELTDDGRTLAVRASTQSDNKGRSLTLALADDGPTRDNIVVRAFATQKKILARLSPAGDTRLGGDARERGIAIPVKGRQGFFGLLEFRADRVDYPRERFAKFLAHLAAQVGIAHDRDRAIEGLRESESLFSSTFELAAIGLCHVGSGGRIIHVNPTMSRMLGYTKAELLGRTVADISHPEDRYLTRELGARLNRREIDHFEIEKRYVRKDGDVVWVRIKSVMKWDTEGRGLYHISVVEDISARKRAEQKIEHMATHDELTGLPNRALFNELVSQAIERRERDENASCALLFVDLDRFKNINDSLGHAAGDSLLQQTAERIGSAIRRSDRVARFGGDEFVVLLNEIEEARDAEDVALKVLHAMSVPMTLAGQECRVTASIGIAVCPDDGTDAQTLIRNADAAMYSAKQGGRNDIERYSVDLTPTAINRVRLETQLRYALDRHEFRILYQPRVEAATGRVIAAEALIRWWNAELGTIAPVQFVPVAEESGLIIPMGRWVLDAACRQHRAWRDRGLGELRVSVNLSPKQFADPDLTDAVQRSIEDAGMQPAFLELEITESMLMSNIEKAIETARELRALGVRLAIDDFGTGYSSLMQLKRFPLDTLKIDRSFVRELPANRADRAITEAIIAMGKTLGVSVVAEGIENEGQRQLLHDLDCDEFQGYLFGKPAHPDEVAAMVGESRAAEARAAAT